MFIELHMIQNFSPANLNRDDTNNPKDCEFGGHRRARISSQALKRAIRRESVFTRTTQAQNGERSKRINQLFGAPLVNEFGKTQEEVTPIIEGFSEAYLGKGAKVEKNGTTNMLFYISQEERYRILQILVDNWEDAVADIDRPAKEKTSIVSNLAKDVVKGTTGIHAPDIALFGRMLAGQPTLNIDAACQVAHAISTHRISMEMDFYTAVDDLQELEEDEGAGASMMGFINFNSACFYRYARIDFEQLVTNLDGDVDLARRTVEGFLRAAIDAIPTGKQNSFAAQNPTSLAVALVRKDGKSWNLANAFEEPVRAGRETGIVVPSIQALDDYWHDLTERRDDAQFEAVAVWTDSAKHEQALTGLARYQQPKLSAWIEAVTAALPKE